MSRTISSKDTLPIMLDPILLNEYCKTFLGYGNVNSPIWYIGQEEAGGHCIQEIQNRLLLWSEQFGKSSIVDAAEFHRQLEGCNGATFAELFENPPRLQSTWESLIHIHRAFQKNGRTADSESAVIQAKGWGRSDSNNLLLELFPAPSPRQREWRYSSWVPPDSHFSKRSSYKNKYRQDRISLLKKLIEKHHHPKAVVFYGTSSARCWSAISGRKWKSIKKLPFKTEPSLGVKLHSHNRTCFALVPHPASPVFNSCKRTKAAFYDWVGKELRKRCR
jgi:hypothetical protein